MVGCSSCVAHTAAFGKPGGLLSEGGMAFTSAALAQIRGYAFSLTQSVPLARAARLSNQCRHIGVQNRFFAPWLPWAKAASLKGICHPALQEFDGLSKLWQDLHARSLGPLGCSEHKLHVSCECCMSSCTIWWAVHIVAGHPARSLGPLGCSELKLHLSFECRMSSCTAGVWWAVQIVGGHSRQKPWPIMRKRAR